MNASPFLTPPQPPPPTPTPHTPSFFVVVLFCCFFFFKMFLERRKQTALCTEGTRVPSPHGPSSVGPYFGGGGIGKGVGGGHLPYEPHRPVPRRLISCN